MATLPADSLRRASRRAQNHPRPATGVTADSGQACARHAAPAGQASIIADLPGTARRFGTPLLDLEAIDPRCCPADLIDLQLVRRHTILPLYRRGNRVAIATADPADSDCLNEITFHTGLAVDVVMAAPDQLQASVAGFLDRCEAGAAALEELDGVDVGDVEVTAVGGDEDPNSPVDDAPIVRFVNKLLLDAVRGEVSDIHLEPYEKIYRVRFRKDGLLQEVTQPPISLAARIASRIKVMANLDISARRLPQDGRIRLRLPRRRAIDFRVNTLPTLWGEKIVLRLLNSSRFELNIDGLGFSPDQKRMYLDALEARQGLILVTGPTGSGKTVSLYAGINRLNTSERNISTAEDPVEINLEGVNQVAVNDRGGLDFATALRAFLRQDPDVIMVGEIRDPESAEIAIKAAQTGHLVLSTLHTNSAADTLVRLRNMGVAAFNLAASVSLIIAQRLLRRLCSHCKETVKVPERVLLEEGFKQEDLNRLQIHRAVGCGRCHGGYLGRIGIYEVVPITPTLKPLIMAGGSSIELAESARRQGFESLRQSALHKVARGLTSLEEANRLACK